MAVLYSNNASSTLSASITSTATSLSVASGAGALFPAPSGADYFYITLVNSAGAMEIMKVAARSADTLTVVRGQDGTTGVAWAAGDRVELRFTKAMLDDFKTDTRAGYLPLSGGTLTGTLNVNANDGLKATYGGTDGDTWYRGWGMESNRTTVYIRPTTNGVQSLRIGYSENSQNWIGVRVDANTFTHNGYNVLNANNYTNYAAAASHTHSYLPLSGGALTGNITFGNFLKIAQDNTDWSNGNYFRGSTDHFVLGVQSGGTLYLNYGNEAGTTRISGTTLVNGNQVLHAGNFSSYALPNPGSGTGGRVLVNLSGNPSWSDASFTYDPIMGQFRATNFRANVGDAAPTWNFNAILHAGNYTNYGDGRYVLKTGDTMTGTLKINTAGSTSSTSHVIIKRSGAAEPSSFGSYNGSWRSSLEIWNNNSTKMLFMNSGETDFDYAHIKSVNSGLVLDVGSNGGVRAFAIGTDGTVKFDQGESINLYGARGRYANQYMHLYSKVGVGHPSGWGQGETNTPSEGLSTYGGINIAYGTNASSTFSGRTQFNRNGRSTYYTDSNIEVYTGDNTPPSIAFHRGGYSATSLYENDGELYVNSWVTRSQNGKLLSSGNYTSYTDSRYMRYVGINTGDWQTFTDNVGEVRIDQVNAITGGAHSNYPTGVYTYGSVMSWRGDNHSFQLYASHTGDLSYKSQWNNDNYTGWQRILTSLNYTDYGDGRYVRKTGDTMTGTLTVGRDVIVNGQTGGNYGNRIVVGASDTSYTMQDTNLRPTIQANGQYPVLSLNHTVTSNSNHGPTIQMTANGVGNQFVIGMTGTGSALDMGYSNVSGWNPHNGIAGYSGTTFFRATSGGMMGLGAPGNWGGLGNGDPGYHLHVKGYPTFNQGYAGVFQNTGGSNGGGWLFQNDAGNHSWGATAEFRVNGTGDRPSVIFSTAAANTSWSVGFVTGSDDTFRISKNHGHRAYYGGWADTNSGWGTAYFSITSAGVASANGGTILSSANYTSYALGANSKAVDSDKLDGYDSYAFSATGSLSCSGDFQYGSISLSGNSFSLSSATTDADNHGRFYFYGTSGQIISRYMPIDKSGLYRMKIRWKASAANATYIAVFLLDTNGNNISGAGTYWAYPWSGGGAPTAWQTNEWWYDGSSFPSNAAYVAFGISHTNYYGGNATYYVSQLEMERVNKQISGNTVLHAGNYTNYVVGLGGGTLTGNLSISGSSTQIFFTGNTAATLIQSFSGIDTKFSIYNSGTSIGISNALGTLNLVSSSGVLANGNTILHAGNYTSYGDGRYLRGDGTTPVTANNLNFGIGRYFGYTYIQTFSGENLHLNPSTSNGGDVYIRGNLALHAGNISSYVTASAPSAISSIGSVIFAWADTSTNIFQGGTIAGSSLYSANTTSTLASGNTYVVMQGTYGATTSFWGFRSFGSGSNQSYRISPGNTGYLTPAAGTAYSTYSGTWRLLSNAVPARSSYYDSYTNTTVSNMQCGMWVRIS